MTYWDDNATPAGVFNVGDMYNEYTRRQAAFIVEQLDVTTGTVIDWGCGIGRLIDPVAEALPHVSVWGLDSSQAMVEEAAATCRHGYFSYSLDIFGSVAGAFSVLTFQHLPDDTVKQHLKDLFVILKPGARLVSQWVTSGEEAPMSYPRDWDAIHKLHLAAGFGVPRSGFFFTTDDVVTQYANDWLWVTAEKPA